jgi:hypothetical protein
MIGKTRVLQSYRQEDALSILFESHFRLLGSFYWGGASDHFMLGMGVSSWS